MAQQSKERKRKKKSKNYYLDAVLIAFILISAGFIWKSFHFQKRPNVPRAETQEVTKVVAGPAAARREVRKGALEESRYIDDAQWTALRPEFAKKIVSESLGCSRNAAPASALYFFDFDLGPRLKEGHFRNAWIFTANDCYRVGSKILLIGGSPAKPSDPYVKILGEAEVLELVRGPVREFPESLFRGLGLGRARLETFDYIHPQDGSVFVLIRFGNIRLQAAAPNIPPLQFPATRVLTGVDARNAAMAKNAVLVDVRTPEEFQKSSVRNSINVPFGVSPMPFSWKESSDQVLRSKFDVGQLLSKKNETLIIYGTDRSDGRSFWALAELYRNGFRKMIWIPEGVSKLN